MQISLNPYVKKKKNYGGGAALEDMLDNLDGDLEEADNCPFSLSALELKKKVSTLL